MNKTDVINQVAARAGVTQAGAGRCVDALMELICDEIAKGNEVNLTGYLKVSTTQRAARVGRNPQTGEKVDIPASRGVKVQAGSRLKAAAKG